MEVMGLENLSLLESVYVVNIFQKNFSYAVGGMKQKIFEVKIFVNYM